MPKGRKSQKPWTPEQARKDTDAAAKAGVKRLAKFSKGKV